jgi:hypothetical protein
VAVSAALLSVIADGVVDAVTSDDVVGVDDGDPGNEPWDEVAVDPDEEL